LAQQSLKPVAQYIVDRFHPVTGSHELGIGVGNRLDNSVGTGQYMSLLKACFMFHPLNVDRETFTAETLEPLLLLRKVTQAQIDAVMHFKPEYLKEAAKARMPADWVGSRRCPTTGMRKLAKASGPTSAAATTTAAATTAAAAATATAAADSDDDDDAFDDDEEEDDDGQPAHPRRRMQRHKFAHGGRDVYKEEDWVSHWWRSQRDGEGAWAQPFKTLVEEVSLVRLNSAMVERLWSLYNAKLKAHGHAYGPGELERVVKKRFGAVYRKGGL
jgi:hypothetical protein